MSSTSDSDSGIGCGVILIGVTLACVFFTGEPDLVDALIYHLYDGNVPVVEEPAE